MDLTELLAVATDCTFGEIKREMVFKMKSAEYGNTEKQLEFGNFEMWHLDGGKLEMMSATGEGFEIYLSQMTSDGLKCYHVEYKPECTKIFEVKPVKGELTDDFIRC